MDDHGYDQAACRRAAELLREEAERLAERGSTAPHPVDATEYHRQSSDCLWAARHLDGMAGRA